MSLWGYCGLNFNNTHGVCSLLVGLVVYISLAVQVLLKNHTPSIELPAFNLTLAPSISCGWTVDPALGVLGNGVLR